MVTRRSYDLESIDNLLREEILLDEKIVLSLDSKFSEVGSMRDLVRVLLNFGVPLRDVISEDCSSLSGVGRFYLQQNARREDGGWGKIKKRVKREKIDRFYELSASKNNLELYGLLEVSDLISIGTHMYHLERMGKI
jgi:hypothetical protein